MSVLSLLVRLCVHSFVLHPAWSKLIQESFFSVEWSSSIPTAELISGDTLEVQKIALISNNQVIESVTPDVTGFQSPGFVTDSTHRTASYPVKHSFSVRWDFGATLTAIDTIEILTNCGDALPSLFCSQTQLTFNTSTGRKAVSSAAALLKNIIKVRLFRFEDDCLTNTLVLDRAGSVDPECGWECEECLQFLEIDLSSMTLQSSHVTNNTIMELIDTTSVDAAAQVSSLCECPMYNLQSTDNQLQVWNDGDLAGLLAVGGNADRVMMTWSRWMGQETTCRQYYVPNEQDFLSVPSYQEFQLEFVFNHTDGPLYTSYAEEQAVIDEFRLDVEELLHDLFEMSWVDAVYINPTATDTTDNTTSNTTEATSYTVNIISNAQAFTTTVMHLQSTYNLTQQLIADSMLDLISESFFTNASLSITDVSLSQSITIPSDTNTCNHTLANTTPATSATDAPFLLLILLIPVAVILCTVALVMLICYKRHLACFKLKWESKTSLHNKNKAIDVSDGAVMGNTTTNGAANLFHTDTIIQTGEGEPSVAPSPMAYAGVHGGNQVQANHWKSESIRISPSHVPAISQTAQSTTLVSLKSDKSTPIRTIGQSMRARNLDDLLDRFSNKTTSTAPVVYLDVEEARQSANAAAAQQRESEDDGRFSMLSSNYDPNSSNYAYADIGPYADGQGQIELAQLQQIPSITAHTVATSDIDDQFMPKKRKKMAKSKIDDALDRVKKNNKVIEFTDFEKQLKLINMIGEGSFGKVYKAKWDAEFVAVKIFTNVASKTMSSISEVATTFSASTQATSKGSSLGLTKKGGGVAMSNMQLNSVDDESYKELYAEIVLATQIPPHPNIVRINGFCRSPLCVVMEFMAGGSVQRLVYGLTNKPAPAVIEKFVILVKACYGLAKLTEYNLHHRDVAARNILLGDYQHQIDDNTKVKITDFGMTRQDDDSGEKVQKTKADGGPFKWMAPESIREQVYDEKTDVYMFGITIWEIMYGREPYEDMDAINAAMNVCMKDERPEFLWDLPSGLKTLIKKCWDKEPMKRPTFKELAVKLQKLQGNLLKDMKENHEMDQVVEDENTRKEEKIHAYETINRFSSVLSLVPDD